MNCTFNRKTNKRIAIMMLGVLTINLLQPLTAFALTSGPGQPESQSFQPVGITDMVDLGTGDFKYNIPLLDVDGYPLNLNYQSGVGMDDEASWVGLGWNLNVGAISRQLRGIPDDFAGDEIETEHYTKKKITVGGRITAKLEKFGNAKIGGSFSFGIFSDNYTGIGAEIGANAGMSFSLTNSGLLTSGLGIGVLSNTASGVDVSPNVSLSIMENSKEKTTNIASLTSSLGYNSRSGLKSLSFGGSFSNYNSPGMSLSFNTEPVMPKIQIPYKSKYGSFSFDAGGVAFGIFGGVGGTGYRSIREVEKPIQKKPGYGFLYAELGKDNSAAVMDFTREKENPVIPELPNLALPVHTPDIFTYNSQTGSGQFRLYRGGTGIFFDNKAEDKSTVETFGGDVGFGAYAHGGISHFEQQTGNKTSKWRNSNRYLEKGDFQNASKTDPRQQHVYFRKADEKNIEDTVLNVNKLHSQSLLSISTSGNAANSSFLIRNNYSSNLKAVNQKIVKDRPQVQSTAISYLTANEAAVAGLNKTIDSYEFNKLGLFQVKNKHAVKRTDSIVRKNDPVKKKHHISEITVTGSDGQRAVYGLPVYNLKHEEYSFAMGEGYDSKDGIAAIGENGIVRNKGIDHYYHKETQAPYAYSYLLTGILSADHSAKNIDSPSVDDQGTAIRFRYSKISNYQWRTPYNNKFNDQTIRKTAALNRGLLADPEDDKGSIVYGEKEIYYVHSIESKTKIAYFITEDRQDAIGVNGLNGDMKTGVRQKRLKEIRLYSKFNTSKPIKVVKFDYDYELCPGTPNSDAATKGKLTLKRVWFEYGLTQKGANHPYSFTYNNKYNNVVVSYANMKSDRWGTYKAVGNHLNGLTNEEFPYSTQLKDSADAAAALWHIKSIQLPSGGKIEVNYEADDYAYVQNKRAMVMVPFTMDNNSQSLDGTEGIQIALDELPPSRITNLSSCNADLTQWFKRTYLNGSDYIYTKSYVKISNKNARSSGMDYEFIPSYCKVSCVTVNNGVAKVMFEKSDAAGVKVNPILFAAWQRLKNEYPRYAYPGYNNKVGDGVNGLEAAVTAIFSAAGNLSELKENFYKKANRKKYATAINLTKSFAKIVKTSGFKIGGGVRVKNVIIKDNWDEFTGDKLRKEQHYGQSYDYTTIDNGKKISSGVATYEPSIGNDENALKQPIPYIQKIKGAINNYFELEEPIGESFYPAPAVGYSKVTVRDLDPIGKETPNTGFIVNEFYTAKDFPVRIKVSPMQRHNPRPSSTYSLIKTQSVEEMILSQGYSIELNDMHGKAKANRIYNRSGSEISSTEYFYKADGLNTEEPILNNRVKVISPSGQVENKIIGRDIEFFTDFREQETSNSGDAINIGLDVIPAFWFPIPLPHWPVNGNNEYKLFRSACAVKVIQTTGLISKVVKTENGSSIAVENVAYDGVTGEALVTKTQNEFKKSYYSVNLPAYWAYKGMGPAYQTLGGLLQNLNTGANGVITNSTYSGYLMAGDELVDVSLGGHYWVIETAGAKRLIDREGKVKTVSIEMAKVIRSGYRNMLQPPTSTLVCMENPIEASQFKLAGNGDLSSLKVISTSTNLFDEKWAIYKNAQIENGLIETVPFFVYVGVEFPNGSNFKFTNKPQGPDGFIENEFWKNKNFFDSVVVTSNISHSRTGFDFCLTIPQDGYYSVGACQAFVKIDDNFLAGYSNYYFPPTRDFYTWNLYPEIFLSAGKHKLQIDFFNGKGGVEVYRNTVNELINVDGNGTGINRIFSTAQIKGKTDLFSWRDNPLIYRHYSFSGGPIDICTPPISATANIINPYFHGYLGNWRPSQTKVYQETRKYADIFNHASKSMDTKTAGYLNSFNPWWRYQNGLWIENPSVKWATANTVTLYDKYGQELENKDALGRYSAANFDFNGQLPSAVASNAMNREIYVNSFEDTKFRLANDSTVVGEFRNASAGSNMVSLANSSLSHSGNYCLNLNSNGILLNTNIHSLRHKTISYLTSDATGYKLKDTLGLYPKGFAPLPAEKYIISTWVKDAYPGNRSINIAVAIKGENGSSKTVSLTCKAIVEGWKLLEGEFNTGDITSGNKLQLTMKSNSGIVNIDDVRIHPKAAHMKTYAYDDKNFKLMAELDENAFATFYEYDDEGSLVRVKKETERGIMTIKESRSSYKKNGI
ncbi:hypothetical protein [Pedobacter nyackensis]|uniref:hypothetical protein n=1 Tax=Pedobacter nyackensis TaxID=475255 RepID=UPI00292ED505|nr:hypothetical protein [Pedobacter nyackensis]